MFCTENNKGGSITVQLTSCLTGLESLVCLAIFFFFLQNRLIQTSQTGGQWYSDTPALSIPCFCVCNEFCIVVSLTACPYYSPAPKSNICRLSGISLHVIVLSVVKLNVVMLSAVMLSVVALLIFYSLKLRA
jgi:hypothetical protein